MAVRVRHDISRRYRFARQSRTRRNKTGQTVARLLADLNALVYSDTVIVLVDRHAFSNRNVDTKRYPPPVPYDISAVRPSRLIDDVFPWTVHHQRPSTDIANIVALLFPGQAVFASSRRGTVYATNGKGEEVRAQKRRLNNADETILGTVFRHYCARSRYTWHGEVPRGRSPGQSNTIYSNDV